MASAYQGAIEAVVAMVICALAGYWIDGRLGSGPVGLFVGMGIGLAALVVRLLRIQAPNLGRPELEPPAAGGAQGGRAEDEADERGADWAQALTPLRERDEEDGEGPKSK